MALGNNIILNCEIDGVPQTPARVECPWTTIHTKPETQDADPIVNPTTECIAADAHIFVPNVDAGQLFAVRLGYDDSLTGITDCVINTFGRQDSDDIWQRLETLGGLVNITLTTDTTNDVTDGTLKYTAVDQVDNVWHTQGCREFLVGVKTALAGTGTVTNSIVQVRFID